MWVVQGNSLSMVEGDYGIQLPIVINGPVFSLSDKVRITFKTAKNGTEILTKDYTPQDNTINIELTEAESEAFPVGVYAYSLDWYQAGSFLCNIVPAATFKVVDKA